MNIAHWLAEQASARPQAPALFHGKEAVCDYGGFHSAAARFAGGLKEKGIHTGDRVALFFDNHPQYLIALLGCWYAGAVAVPMNARLHAKEALWICCNAGALLCVTKDRQKTALAERTRKLPLFEPEDISSSEIEIVERDTDDLAWLFYTSGTTGRPKGVMITYRMLTVMSQSYLSSVDDVGPEDSTIYAAPMSHGAGLYALVHVLRGARHVVPRSVGFDTAELLELAAHFGRAQCFAAPTMVKRLTAHARETGAAGNGLRSIIYGGGPMYMTDVIEAVDQFGPLFVQIYGQGEAPMAITALSRSDIIDRSHPNWRARLGSVGLAQEGVDLRVDRNGEVMVRGDLVMPGYWRNPAATENAIQNGWLRTGDIGELDTEGYLTLKDRAKDMIISGGSNIYPREVEEALLEHPSVEEAAVVGRNSEEWGEEVVAFIVPTSSGFDPCALDAHCLSHIARYKRPRAYFARDTLPKNNYGKVLKTELRKDLEQDN
ncbi:MAG: AMP-binding protein [Pseudomonadota bacterium]